MFFEELEGLPCQILSSRHLFRVHLSDHLRIRLGQSLLQVLVPLVLLQCCFLLGWDVSPLHIHISLRIRWRQHHDYGWHLMSSGRKDGSPSLRYHIPRICTSWLWDPVSPSHPLRHGYILNTQTLVSGWRWVSSHTKFQMGSCHQGSS